MKHVPIILFAATIAACSEPTEVSHDPDNTCEVSTQIVGNRLEARATFYCDELTSEATFHVWTYEDGEIGWERSAAGCYEAIAVSLPMPSKHGALHVDAGAMVGTMQIRCIDDDATTNAAQ